MTNKDAISVIENEIQIDVRLCTDEQVDRFQQALYKAISALSNQIPGEPLTMEQLREMGGRPYWHVGMRDEREAPHWAILDPHIAKHIEDYGYGETWVAYEYPPARLDREAWEPCYFCKTKQCFNCRHDDLSLTDEPCNSCVGDKWEPQYKFCPKCGRPFMSEAWDMLEKRLRG